ACSHRTRCTSRCRRRQPPDRAERTAASPAGPPSARNGRRDLPRWSPPADTKAEPRRRAPARAWLSLRLLLRRFLGGLFFLGARAGEDARHRVIAFVARVLEDRPLDLFHRQRSRPRSGERLRIVDRELVVDRIRVDPAEALDHLQGLAGAF